jgi:acylphosphatase
VTRPPVARRLLIAGRVQGVGFREATVDAARAARVSGWVRNRSDGTVEVLAQGEPAAVDRLVEWCRRGPRIARVTSVEIAAADADPELEGFRRLPTA